MIGFPAGGPLDRHARLLTDKLQAVLGQPVVVDYSPAPADRSAPTRWRPCDPCRRLTDLDGRPSR